MRGVSVIAGKSDDVHSDLVLVLDDDEFIRDLVKNMLQHLGYSVITCATGEDAIERYKRAMEAGWPFYAAILDLLVVDGMGGAESAKEILRIDPAAKLIVSSGYSDEPVLAKWKAYGFTASLAKPYTLKALSDVLESLRS
ncbi:response regulator [Geomonas limicola]|uniref:Response regulator n=1 Tax=Geomonas limicola TaxID=2740186 RepID=A0A6V8NEM5_9BACT|nr:response regulator [Geomonas limicola]GFO70023.1 response regulator [Geomonas limicola]